jgi:hypothetical protein
VRISFARISSVNRRAILTKFGVKSASKIDHPILIKALPAVRSELGSPLNVLNGHTVLDIHSRC